MRKDLLMAAQQEFFAMYPLGFNDPEMIEISKKHKVVKMHEMALEMFGKDKYGFVEEMIENMIKIISRSSLVSVFEKPKFRDFARSLSVEKKEALVQGLYECLHGNQEVGFNQMVQILVEGKLGKWSLMTVILYYYYPQKEVFCKPTTVKNMIKTFELEGLIYKPRPSYEFYTLFRKTLIEMRSYVDPNLGPDNAAFSGFLMMMMPKQS